MAKAQLRSGPTLSTPVRRANPAALTLDPALRRRAVALARGIAALPTVEGTGAIVLQRAEQHVDANALYRESRALAKAVEASPTYGLVKAERAKLLAAMQAVTQPLTAAADRLSVAIVAWRGTEDDKAAAAARADAPRGEKGSAVARALAQQVETRREAGFAPEREYWHAELDDLGSLAAHVVASDTTLSERVSTIRKDIQMGVLMAAPRDVLRGVVLYGPAGEVASWMTSPALNALAEEFKGNLRIAGVRAVCSKGVVNR